MLEKNRPYFRPEGSKVILETFKCEIYVPDYYFDVKLAVQDGEIFDLFFIAKYRLFHKDTDDISKLPLYDFKVPTMILTRPDEVRRDEMNLFGVKERFTIFVYYRGGEILYNSDIVRNATSAERYVNLLIDGKIRIPYAKVNDTTNKMQKIHGKLNVPQYTQQLLISNIYRDKNDLSRSARFVAKPGDTDGSNIRGLNMRENSAFTSTLAGVGFEDVKSMLTVADNRDDSTDSSLSRIEKVIKGIREQ